MGRKYKVALGGMAAAIILSTPAAALAESCANVSRAAPPCNLSCTSPVIEGNWAWLPSVAPGAPAIWVFAPPGTGASVEFGLPGANGNYTNGKTSSLLGVSAICNGGATSRQSSHGIQTGCE